MVPYPRHPRPQLEAARGILAANAANYANYARNDFRPCASCMLRFSRNRGGYSIYTEAASSKDRDFDPVLKASRAARTTDNLIP